MILIPDFDGSVNLNFKSLQNFNCIILFNLHH